MVKQYSPDLSKQSVLRAAWLAVLVLLAGALAPPAEATPRAGAGTVLVLGDSLSAAFGIERQAGWVSLLEDHLLQHSPSWQVVNASISGETTGGGLARLPQLLEQHHPAVVVIELGGNDGLRGFPIGTIRDNLDRMVSLSTEAGAEVLLVGMRIPPNYGSRYTTQFHDSFHEVAQQHDVPLLPFLLDGVATRAELMQQDGIHPRAEAQPLILQNVLPHLKRLLAHCCTEKSEQAHVGGS